MNQENVALVAQQPQQQQEEVEDFIRFVGIARWDEEENDFFLVGDYTETEVGCGRNTAQQVLQQLKERDEVGTVCNVI